MHPLILAIVLKVSKGMNGGQKRSFKLSIEIPNEGPEVRMELVNFKNERVPISLLQRHS